LTISDIYAIPLPIIDEEVFDAKIYEEGAIVE
jgi:hypothetical protein